MKNSELKRSVYDVVVNATHFMVKIGASETVMEHVWFHISWNVWMAGDISVHTAVHLPVFSGTHSSLMHFISESGLLRGAA